MGTRDFDKALKDLLARAKNEPDADKAAAQVKRAMEMAAQHGIRRSRYRDLPGIAGHYGRIDAARIALTCSLVLALGLIVLWSIVSKDPDHAAVYASPLSGLAGIGLGWLFAQQIPTVLDAEGMQLSIPSTASHGDTE